MKKRKGKHEAKKGQERKVKKVKQKGIWKE
jgi:hypothetical protein